MSSGQLRPRGRGPCGGVAGHCEISQPSPQKQSYNLFLTFLSHSEPSLVIVAYMPVIFLIGLAALEASSNIQCMNGSSFKPSYHAAEVRECAHENRRREMPHLRRGFERSLYDMKK